MKTESERGLTKPGFGAIIALVTRGAEYTRLRDGEANPETLEPDPDNAGVGSTDANAAGSLLWACLFAFLPPNRFLRRKQT